MNTNTKIVQRSRRYPARCAVALRVETYCLTLKNLNLC